MHYRESMEQAAAYMDAHCREEISAVDLAQRYGYSFYHFCHIFRACIGLSPGKYLRRARLQAAAAELSAGRSVTEVALDYGFDTPGGFAKAFRKEFNTSPSCYRRECAHTSPIFEKGRIAISPRLESKPAFWAVGCETRPQNEDIDILEHAACWHQQDYSQVDKEDYARIAASDLGEVGLWTHPEETSGQLAYFYGPIVKKENDVPAGMNLLAIPAADYAVFPVEQAAADYAAGDLAALRDHIRDAWKYIYREWFEKSGKELDQSKLSFEFYHGHRVEIWTPVKLVIF